MRTIAPAAPPVLASARALAGECTDQALVASVRAGDDRAFEKLYARYHRRIASYIYGMVNDYGRAEDIAQDVFMSALRRMRETDRAIAFKPWIYEIAKNACIDQFRRSRRTEEVSYDAEDGLGASDYGRLVTTGPTPDVAVDQKMSLDHLRGAFGGLSETHHEILVMRELEGLSYREIGEKLGMSRPSVESTLFRARRRLSEEYSELISGERCLRVQAIIATAAQGSLGTRDQRRMARHVSHCQPCRRHARAAGLDSAILTVPKPVRAKVAALLPLPAFLRRRWGSEADAASSAGAGHFPTIAQWSAQIGATVDPAIASWAKAAAAAATIAVAGMGAGAATQHASGLSSLARDLTGSKSPVRVASPKAGGVNRSPVGVTALPTPLHKGSKPSGSVPSTGKGTDGRGTVDSGGIAPEITPPAPPASGVPDINGIVDGTGGNSGGGGGNPHPERTGPAQIKGVTNGLPTVTIPAVPPLGGDAGGKAQGAVGEAGSKVQKTADDLLGGG